MKGRFRRIWPYLLFTPALVYYILFWIRPVIQAVGGSFMDPDGAFTLLNYVEVFKDPLFSESLVNSLLFALISVILQFVLALMIALILNRKFRGSKLLLFIALIPMAIPPMATAVLWRSAFATHGWFNSLLHNIGLMNEPVQWLTMKGQSAVGFLVLIDTWTVLPSVMIILLAGLQNMNKEYEEAGYVFGATKLRAIKDITIPILKPTIVTAVILRMISALQIWLLSVMMFGYGRVPMLVERIAYYSEIVARMENSYQLSVTYSVVITVIVMVSAVVYLKISNRERRI